MGHRLENVAGRWEYICRVLLGSTSINLDKLDGEGEWRESQIVLGFEVNVGKLTIKLPDVQISNARDAIMNNTIGPGNRVSR